MIYLDYAANTPVDEEVLDEFVKATKKYIANPNSTHKAGKEAKEAIEKTSSDIANYFNCKKEGIIYTSGASESNNLVLKGIAKQKKKGKIIISATEHSSIVAPCNYLAEEGYEISVIELKEDGIIDLENLKKELDEDTILVSINAVDSELGTIQPIEKIGEILKEYPSIIFHTDATQAIGKTDINYENVDFITFAPHKFFGLNGIGVLVNRNNKKLIPLIHGGKSTTIFRSGTPVTANIIALNKAFELATQNLKERKKYLKKLNKKLRENLEKIKSVHINSKEFSIPSTLNISLIDKKAKDIVKKLEENKIYLSTTTACSLENMPSKSVYAITKDENLAKNTIRISISHKTTEKEIDKFLKVFKELLK